MTATATSEAPIKPAIAAHAWRVFLGLGHSMPMGPAGGAHALAAISLHEQPFGFGWPDHDMLIDLAGLSEAQAEWSDKHGSLVPTPDEAVLWSTDAAANRRRAADLRSIAARIAALLAPR